MTQYFENISQSAYSDLGFFIWAPRLSFFTTQPGIRPLGFPVGTYAGFGLSPAGRPLGFPVGTYGPFGFFRWAPCLFFFQARLTSYRVPSGNIHGLGVVSCGAPYWSSGGDIRALGVLAGRAASWIACWELFIELVSHVVVIF